MVSKLGLSLCGAVAENFYGKEKNEMIPIFKPSIKRRDMDAVLTTLVSEKIGAHDKNQELVDVVTHYLGLKSGLAVREYRRAVELAYDALALEEGSLILMSALTPYVYYEAALQRGLKVQILDVDDSAFSLHPDSIAEVHDQGPAAMVVHHSLGILPDMDQIAEFEIPIIEDISYSLGAVRDEAKAGSWGKIVVMSLEEDFLATCGGGALVMSGQGKIASFLRARSKSVERNILLPDMNAALGVSQFQLLDKLLDARKEIAAIFKKAILKSRHKSVFQSEGDDQGYFAFPLIIDSGMPEVIKYAAKKKIETRMLFGSDTLINRVEAREVYPVASSYSLRCLLFPLYPMLGKQNVELIAKVLGTLP